MDQLTLIHKKAKACAEQFAGVAFDIFQAEK